MSPVTTATLRKMKEDREPIAMITAYDYPTAKVVDAAGIEIILVGDSLGMVVLGYDSTVPVTVNDILHHTKAVTRGTDKALVVADLPFLSYHGPLEETLKSSARLMQEGGARAVKLEGGREVCPTIEKLVAAGVPVMGHIGLTPQSVHQLGGYKVQGKDVESAQRLIADAQAVEEAGVFALVLECIPAALAQKITESVNVPTIGIGAGPHCDGQVLVFHDLVGFGSDLNPKFVKQYAQADQQLIQAVKHYVQEVKTRAFPAEEHSFSMNEQVLGQLYGGKADEN